MIKTMCDYFAAIIFHSKSGGLQLKKDQFCCLQMSFQAHEAFNPFISNVIFSTLETILHFYY